MRNWVLGLIPVTLALGKLRQKHCYYFKASLGYKVSEFGTEWAELLTDQSGSCLCHRIRVHRVVLLDASISACESMSKFIPRIGQGFEDAIECLIFLPSYPWC